jgi:hypothetical protein
LIHRPNTLPPMVPAVKSKALGLNIGTTCVYLSWKTPISNSTRLQSRQHAILVLFSQSSFCPTSPSIGLDAFARFWYNGRMDHLPDYL